MKIRDLRNYIKEIAGVKEQNWILGSKDDAFYTKLMGETGSIEDYVSQVSSFAVDASIQVFYEFIQNASDAGADSMIIYFNSNKLLIVNNGEPFYTDGRIEKDKKGRLRSFLSKGKSNKPKEAIGKYGQGAKLLYTLMLDNDPRLDKEDQLKQTIIRELKGPILFSWSDYSDLKEVFIQQNEAFDYGDFNDYELPLICKIIYTFYPSLPEESIDVAQEKSSLLFSKDELNQFISFFNEAFENSKVNHFNYKTGSALLIPLGIGVQETLLNSFDQNLKAGISTSLALLPSKLNEIYVNREIIKKTSSFSILELNCTPSEENNNSLNGEILYPDHPKEIKQQLSNFYHHFPITNEVHGLKFIINSKDLEIDSSRQNLKEVQNGSKNYFVLEQLGRELQKQIEQMPGDGKIDDYQKLFKNIISTELNHLNFNSKSNDALEKFFYKNLLLSLKKGVLTHENQLRPTEEVIIKKSQVKILPQELGKSSLYWVSDSLSDYYDKIKNRLQVQTWNIINLLRQFDSDNHRNDWFKNLSQEEYKEIFEELNNIGSLPPDLKTIRFSDGEIYSINEIKAQQELVPLDNRTLELKEILCSQGISFGGEEASKYPALKTIFLNDKEVFNRILSQLKVEDLNNYEKRDIFKSVKKWNNLEPNFLRENLAIFTNIKGDLFPLKYLVKDDLAIAPSRILKYFSIAPNEPYFDEMDSLLMKEEEIWPILIKQWYKIQPLIHQGNYSSVLEDLNNLYRLNPTEELGTENWILSQNGELTIQSEVFFNKKLLDLSQSDYMLLYDFLVEHTDYTLINHSHIKHIQQVEFNTIPNVGLSSITSKLREGVNEIKVSKEEIEVLNKIRIHGESFFSTFIISEKDESFVLIPNEQKNIQCIGYDLMLVEFLTAKEKFYLLPTNLENLFKEDNRLRKESPEFIKDLVDNYGSRKAFINLIPQADSITKNTYIQGVKRIDLYSHADSINPDSFEAKFIELIVKEGQIEHGRKIIHIDEKFPLESISYNENVILQHKDNKITFNLSDLVPEFSGRTDLFSSIKYKLLESSIQAGGLFNTEDYDNFEIENKILSNEEITHLEQIGFLITFYQDKNYHEPVKEAPIDDRVAGLSKIEILDYLFLKKIYQFHDYLPQTLIDPCHYIYSNELSLLLESEKLSQDYFEWLNSGNKSEKLKYLKKNNLEQENSKFLKIRRKLTQNEKVESNLIEKLPKNKRILRNTLQWFSEEISIAIYNEENYKAITEIIQSFFDRFNNELPGFQFVFCGDQRKLKLSSINSIDNRNYYYLRTIRDFTLLELGAAKYKSTFQILDLSRNYSPQFINSVKNVGIQKIECEGDFAADKLSEKQEWENPAYLKWRETNTNYKIYLSDQKLPYSYRFIFDSEEEKEIKTIDEGEAEVNYASEECHEIFLHISNEESIHEVLELLFKHKDRLFENSPSALIDLLAQFKHISEEDSELLETLKNEDIQTDELTYLIKNKDTLTDLGQKLSERERGLLKENLDNINKLLEKANSEALESFIDKFDLIIQFLESENDKSSPNGIIGYIGEVLMAKYLQRTYSPAAVELISVEYDEKGNYIKPSYTPFDIILETGNDRFLIDVKTTIKTIKRLNNSIAFFISKKEYEFIQENDIDNYHITRISLEDLGLNYIYSKIKKQGFTSFDDAIRINQHYIEKEIDKFLSEKGNRELFEKSRFSFKVSIPKFEESPF